MKTGGGKPGYFGVDPCPTLQGMPAFLQHDDAGSLSDDQAVGSAVEGSGSFLRGIVVMGAGAMHQALPQQGHGIDLVFGAAGDHDIRFAALNGANGFADGQLSGSLSAGDGIAGTLQIMNNTHVAAEHIGQIFQEPEWGERLHSLQPPFGEAEGSIFQGVFHSRTQFHQIAADQAGTDVHPAAGRIDLGRFVFRAGSLGLKLGIPDGSVRGHHGQFNVG
ncbi:MAG: hypothetical protein BWY71_01369 [Planctomycetes bacterium ADurb.Bin412]|nr:MAG: hypothetical protein BWY71_01369 [Planctomycetes bacterium ADurb.Bin412]